MNKYPLNLSVLTVAVGAMSAEYKGCVLMCKENNDQAAGRKMDAGEVIQEVKEWVVFVSTVALFFYALKSGSKMSLPG